MMPYMAISLGAESVGQGEVCEQKVWERGEVVGYTWRVQTAWPCLGLAVKGSWLEPG